MVESIDPKQVTKNNQKLDELLEKLNHNRENIQKKHDRIGKMLKEEVINDFPGHLREWMKKTDKCHMDLRLEHNSKTMSEQNLTEMERKINAAKLAVDAWKVPECSTPMNEDDRNANTGYLNRSFDPVIVHFENFAWPQSVLT